MCSPCRTLRRARAEHGRSHVARRPRVTGRCRGIHLCGQPCGQLIATTTSHTSHSRSCPHLLWTAVDEQRVEVDGSRTPGWTPCERAPDRQQPAPVVHRLVHRSSTPGIAVATCTDPPASTGSTAPTTTTRSLELRFGPENDPNDTTPTASDSTAHARHRARPAPDQVPPRQGVH